MFRGARSPDLLQILACQLHVLEDFQKQPRPDQLSCMNGDNRISPVLMPQGMVAPLDPDQFESKPLQDPDEFFPFESRKSRHRSDPDALDSDESRGSPMVLLVLQAQLDHFPNPLHERIQRLRLGMAAPQIGNRRHKIPLRILLDDHIEISCFCHAGKMRRFFENAMLLWCFAVKESLNRRSNPRAGRVCRAFRRCRRPANCRAGRSCHLPSK